MPVMLEPRLTASGPENTRAGRLALMHIRQDLRLGFIAHVAERPILHFVPLLPADRLQFVPLATAGQSFVDLGEEVLLGCVPGLDTILMSGHEGNDRIGCLLLNGDGAAAIAITPNDDGDARYYTFATGEVGFARPDARAIVTKWSISSGVQERRTKIADITALRPAGDA